MTYPQVTVFDWNEGNIEKSRIKHGITPIESEEVFFQKPLLLFPDTKHSSKEKRFIALGRTKNNIWLIISYTMREEKIRIISARMQNQKERKIYEKEV